MEGKWFVIPDFCSWKRGEYLEEMLDALTAPGEMQLFRDRFAGRVRIGPEQMDLAKHLWYYADMPADWELRPFLTGEYLVRTAEKFGLPGEKYTNTSQLFAQLTDQKDRLALAAMLRADEDKEQREEYYRLYCPEKLRLSAPYYDPWYARNGWQQPEGEYRKVREDWYAVFDGRDFDEYGRAMIVGQPAEGGYALYFAGEEDRETYEIDLAIHDRVGRITPELAQRFGLEELGEKAPELSPPPMGRMERMHSLCAGNHSLIGPDTRCGCFYCRQIYPGRAVSDWLDSGQTARCPHCGIDAVIMDSPMGEIDEKLLKEMNEHWFAVTESNMN